MVDTTRYENNLRMSRKELEPSIWDTLDPLKSHKWEKEGLRLISTFSLYTAIFGYHEYRGKENFVKYISPNIDLVTDPDRALSNKEHIGIWNYVTNIFVPAAMLATIIGIKIKEAAQNSEDNYGLLMTAWVYWWLLRGPLVAIALLMDAVKRVLMVMAVVTIAVTLPPVLLVAAACLFAAAALISKKPSASESKNTEPKHESPTKILASKFKALFSPIKKNAEEFEKLSEEAMVF